MTATASTSVQRRLAGVLAALVVLAAALLVLGTTLERGTHTDSHTAPSATAPAHHDEASEASGSGESHEAGESHAGHSDEHGQAASHETGTEESALVRMAESPLPIAIVVVISLGLAISVWRRPSRPVLAATAAFTLVAGVLDITEVGRQLSAGRTGLALLAILITATRLAALAVTVPLWRATTRTTPT